MAKTAKLKDGPVALQAPTDRIVGREEALALSGFSNMTMYRQIKAGKFPAPVKLSARRVGWKLSSINTWIEARHAA